MRQNPTAALGIAKEAEGSLDTGPASPLSPVDREPQWRHLLVCGRSVLPALGGREPGCLGDGAPSHSDGPCLPCRSGSGYVKAGRIRRSLTRGDSGGRGCVSRRPETGGHRGLGGGLQASTSAAVLGPPVLLLGGEGADWQGLECRAQHNGLAPVGSREPRQVLEQGGRRLKAAVGGAPRHPSTSHPQASRCVPPAARYTASSIVRTPQPHGWSPCWSPSSTWCRPSACPATRGSRWAMDSPCSWVGLRGCEGVLRPGLGPAVAEGGPSPRGAASASSDRAEAREAAASPAFPASHRVRTCSAGGAWGLQALPPTASWGWHQHSARAARPGCKSRGPRWVLTGGAGHGVSPPGGHHGRRGLGHGIGTGGDDLEDGGPGELCRGSKGRGAWGRASLRGASGVSQAWTRGGLRWVVRARRQGPRLRIPAEEVWPEPVQSFGADWAEGAVPGSFGIKNQPRPPNF